MARKKNGGNRKGKKLDADLDGEVNNYELSESDDGIGPDGKILLERAKQGKLIQDNDSEEEVFRVHSSSEDEDEEVEEEEEGDDDKYYGKGVGSDFDSDIEGKADDGDDKLPNDKAWGKKKQKYYNTDYVDQDYGGFGKDEEEQALMEEKEADAIQRRLMSHLEGTDFTLGLLEKVEEKRAELAEKMEEDFEGEKIQTDFSKLSKEEKIQFLKQESPELFPLIDDFKRRLTFVRDKILPVLKLVGNGKIPKCQASDSLKLQYRLIMQYCTNVTYYMFLKRQRLKVDNHPVINKLYTFRKLLEELDTVNNEVLIPQIDKMLKLKEKGKKLKFIKKKPEPEPKNRAERRKRKLKILEDKKILEEKIEKKKMKYDFDQVVLPTDSVVKEKVKNVRFAEPSDESESDAEKETAKANATTAVLSEGKAAEKRGINFKIAKNKGLTPKRKKEQRNPRVKHRNKFKKAKIRRKGQVREARKELQKYSGEVSGIKAYVSKSVKFK